MPGKKRKRDPITLPGEKKRNLEIVNKVLNKKPKIDLEKAISLQKAEARTEYVLRILSSLVPIVDLLFRLFFRRESAAAEEGGKKRKGKGGKGGKGTFGRKKPKGGQGKRNHSKRAVGRKRR